MSNVQSVRPSRDSGVDPTNPKHDEADRLTAWSDGALRVLFAPDVFQGDDLDALGHCYRIRLVDQTPGNSPSLGTVDDRKDPSVKHAVIAELRRMARYHHLAADRLEGKLPIVQENITTWSDRVSRLCLFAAEKTLPSGMRQIVHVGHESEINGYISEWKASHPTEAGTIRKAPVSWQLADEHPHQDDVLDLTPDIGAEADLDRPLDLMPDRRA